jgi:uncharacterized GH25 family protein
MEIQNHTVAPGTKVISVLSFDHSFPAKKNNLFDIKDLENHYAISPSGKKVSLYKKGKHSLSSSRLNSKGLYLFTARSKGLFWSKIAGKYSKYKNKKNSKNVKKCIQSYKFAKALVAVDNPKGKCFKKTTGHTLEIVPQNNPSILNKGDYLKIKVLFRGMPVSINVSATYKGFSTEDNVFAFTGKTNDRGILKIPLTQKGIWLIDVSKRTEHSDRSLCDELLYAATLTFQVK